MADNAAPQDGSTEQPFQVDPSRLPTFVCDECKQPLRYGDNWFHQIGADRDLCKDDFDKAPEDLKSNHLLVNGVAQLVVVYRDAMNSRTKNVSFFFL